MPGEWQSILIDAGKKASAKETRDTVLGREIVHPAIHAQIESVLGSTTLDLLIITHCHSDHVGDLPRLILDEVIDCEYALIADPQLGCGIVGGDAGLIPPVDRLSPAEKLWLALREEPFHSSVAAQYASLSRIPPQKIRPTQIWSSSLGRGWTPDASSTKAWPSGILLVSPAVPG